MSLLASPIRYNADISQIAAGVGDALIKLKRVYPFHVLLPKSAVASMDDLLKTGFIRISFDSDNYLWGFKDQDDAIVFGDAYGGVLLTWTQWGVK